jgi:spheroidene monooxygenase
MIASFHVVTFRRARLLPPARSGRSAQGLRFWTALATAKDPFLTIPPDVSRVRLLKPNLREWAFFGVWEAETDIDRFLRSGRTHGPWVGCSEVWSLWLKPTHARGRWAGVQALGGSGEDALPCTPAAFLTHLDLPAGALRAMWLSAVPAIAPRVGSAAGLLLGLPIMQRPYLNPMTFSLWHSAKDATAFAYQQARHQDAVRRMQDARSDLVARFSSACFYPHRSQGTWTGENPLAAYEQPAYAAPLAP